MPKQASLWKPHIILNSSEQSVWTEDVYHRVLINFASAVESEIRCQQEAVTMERAQLEMEMDTERELFIARNAARRQESESASGSTGGSGGATLVETFQVAMLDSDQKKEWDEREQTLLDDYPLAFLSAEAESSLSFFALFPRLQATLARLTREATERSVLSANPPDDDDDAETDDASRRDTSDEVTGTPSVGLSQYRRRCIAGLAPPRLPRRASAERQRGEQAEAVAENDTVDVAAALHIASQEDVDVEVKFSELAKLIDLRRRATQRMMLLSGAYCTPPSIAALRRRQRLKRQRAQARASRHAAAAASTTTASAGCAGPAVQADHQTHACRAAMEDGSEDVLAVTVNLAQKAVSHERTFLAARLHHAQRQLAAAESAGGDRKARAYWRAEVQQRQRECDASPRLEGYQALVSRSLATWRDAAQSSATRTAAADALAATTPAQKIRRTEREVDGQPPLDKQAPHAGAPSLCLPLSGGSSNRFRGLNRRMTTTLTDLISSLGTRHPWLWQRQRQDRQGALRMTAAGESASVEVRALAATGEISERVIDDPDRSCVYGEFVRLLDADVSATGSNSHKRTGAAYMEQLAAEYLWPAELEARIKHVVYGAHTILDEADARQRVVSSVGFATLRDDDGRRENVDDQLREDSDDDARDDGRSRTRHTAARRLGNNLVDVCQLSAQDVARSFVRSTSPASPPHVDDRRVDDEDDDSENGYGALTELSTSVPESGGRSVPSESAMQSNRRGLLDGTTLIARSVIPRSPSEYAPTLATQNEADHQDSSLDPSLGQPACQQSTVEAVHPLCVRVNARSEDDGACVDPTRSSASTGEDGQSVSVDGCVVCVYGNLTGRVASLPKVTTRAILHVHGHGDFAADTLFLSGGSDRAWKGGDV